MSRRFSLTRKPQSFRPQFEALENRWLPSGFSHSGSYVVSNGPLAMVTADVNHDGILDLISVGDGVSVLLGKAGSKSAAPGTFGTTQNYAVPGAACLAVGDINGDGNLDVITGNGSVLLGKGDGTFNIGPGFTGGLLSYVALADANGDGKLDIITANYASAYSLYYRIYSPAINVLPGNGDGTFQAPMTYVPPFNLQVVTVGNFDGKLDIVAGSTDGTLYLAPGNGNGTFGRPRNIGSAFGGFDAITASDLNRDGKLDIAVTSTYSGPTEWGGSNLYMTVLMGNGNGTFSSGGPASTYNVGGVYGLTSVGLAAADVNGDGKLDLITVGQAGSRGPEVSVLFGNGAGSFGGEVDYLSLQPVTGGGAVSAVNCFAVGDFNGDGTADLAIAGSNSLNASAIDVFFWLNKKK
jgi:hypothetical protein